MPQDERPFEPPAAGVETPVQSDQPADRPTDRKRPSWLTYAQAGDLLGLSPEAVRHRARRSGWRTLPGNDGRTLVLVPDDVEPVRSPDRPPVRTPDQAEDDRASGHAERAFDATLSAIEAAHAAEVIALRERADMAQAVADEAVKRAVVSDARAERAETAIAGERQRSDVAEARTERAERRADRAEAALQGERSRADGLRHRVDALQAELATAKALSVDVEATVIAERARVDELQAGQALIMDMHARALAETQDRLERVRVAAEGLRQADLARKARGRLRRAWDGWRGR